MKLFKFKTEEAQTITLSMLQILRNEYIDRILKSESVSFAGSHDQLIDHYNTQIDSINQVFAEVNQVLKTNF